MVEIEFLPAAYREQTARRRDIAWRLGVLLLFAGMIAASAAYQGWLGLSVRHQLATVRDPRAQAEKTQAEVAAVEQQLQVERARAELYAYLDFPWPRTQLLAALSRPLPEGVSLDQVQFLRQAIPAPVAASGEGAKKGKAPAPPKKTPASPFQDELARLRGLHDASRLVATLRGEATRAEAIHAYLNALAGEPLVMQVRLQSLLSDDPSKPIQFELQVVLRPGHGQSSGPRAPLRPRAEPPHEPATEPAPLPQQSFESDVEVSRPLVSEGPWR